MGWFKELKETYQVYKERDPAIRTYWDVLLYPCYTAMRYHRKAHRLWVEGKHFRARLLSQIAVRRTGIEIHPGAKIGERFFIDHGTGIVIGETAVIGSNVKLYHGVTLGAITTRKGQQLKGRRRHPSVGSNVTIYANATVLGGETHIGSGSTLAGGVLVTESVPENSVV